MRTLAKCFAVIMMALLVAVPLVYSDPPQRNVNGFSTVMSDDPLGWMPYPDPTKWAIYMDDFLVYDLSQGTTYYTFTPTTGTVDTNVGLSGYPGVLVLTFDAGDNDVGQLQVVSGNIIIPAGKKAVFETKIMVDAGSTGAIGEQEILVGLSTVAVTTALTDAGGLLLTANDMIGFWSPDGTANISSVIRVADIESLDSAVATYADDTWLTLSWYYDGAGTTKFYKNDVLVSTSTSALPTAVMSPILFAKAGESVACIFYCDYWMVGIER